MDWTDYLHHDHTPFYTSKPEAEIGDLVRIRLRVPLNAEIQKIELATLRIGEMSKIAMTRSDLSDANWTYFETEMDLTAKRTSYFFMVYAQDQMVKFSARGVQRVNPAFRDWFVFLAEHHRPDWLEDRVFYQIFPDRFFNGDPESDVKTGEYKYMGQPVQQMAWDDLPSKEVGPLQHWGGDLEGIRQKLPYLADLGVNGIYLNPIFTSPSNHRYDTENYLEIDPHLGGQVAFDALLADAKALGFKIILDGVFNHTGDRAHEFKKALENKVEKEMFTFRSDGTYEAFFDVKTLPKLDYDSHLAFDHFLEGNHAPVRHWIRAGADGWRLDVAHMMGKSGTDRGNLEILRRLRNAARLENPQAWIFGERFWDGEPYLQGASDPHEHAGGGEDGVMNYHGFTLPVLDWLAGSDLFGNTISLETPEFQAILEESYRVVPTPMRFSHYNLLGSHDVPRALERLGSLEKMKTAFALLLTYPGVPGIYYGDEIGLKGGDDPHCRAPFPWDEKSWNMGLREFVKTLIHARKTSRALQAGALKFLGQRHDALTFARTYTHSDGRIESALIGVNRGTAQAMNFNTAQVGVFEGSWQDALTGEIFYARDGILKATVFRPRVLLPML